MDRRDSLLAALVALIWGVNFLVIDWGMVGVPPLLFLAFRFVAVALPAVFLVRRPPVSWRVLTVVGLTMSLGQFSLLYLALDQGMPPGLAGLVLQAQVVFTVVLSAAALREVPSRQQTLGVLLGFSGLMVIAAGRGGSVPLVALLLTLLAALSWATGNVVVRAAKVPGGLGLTVWSALVVPVPALALALVVDGRSGVADGLAAFGWEAALSTAYTAVLASLVGYAIFNSLLARWPAAAVVPWILLVPVVSMSAAWVVLGDTPAPGEVAGGVVMLAGLLVALRRPAAAVVRAPAS
ncbi:EamA family transporter [Nocardioides sp.]|uniref:EamA family transporter n=1 Tax=Nocardioides sp. TaxID=35761 RepID=UPI001A1B5794|nr:EamA family transporter [Nocardioides sp.]MBJ7356880.1 EamA family transporter [Nocardioides sp.]